MKLDETWYRIGLDNLLRLLINLEMISDNDEVINSKLLEKVDKKSIKIFGSIIIKWKDLNFSKKFEHMELIKKWDLICFDWEKNIFANNDFLMIMPVSQATDITKMIWEECCFMWEIILI